MLSCCNTPQTSTNLSPAELVYKRILNTRLNLLKLQTNKGTLKQEESKVFKRVKRSQNSISRRPNLDKKLPARG